MSIRRAAWLAAALGLAAALAPHAVEARGWHGGGGFGVHVGPPAYWGPRPYYYAPPAYFPPAYFPPAYYPPADYPPPVVLAPPAYYAPPIVTYEQPRYIVPPADPTPPQQAPARRR